MRLFYDLISATRIRKFKAVYYVSCIMYQIPKRLLNMVCSDQIPINTWIVRLHGNILCLQFVKLSSAMRAPWPLIHTRVMPYYGGLVLVIRPSLHAKFAILLKWNKHQYSNTIHSHEEIITIYIWIKLHCGTIIIHKKNRVSWVVHISLHAIYIHRY